MGEVTPWDHEVRERALELRREGLSLPDISKRLEVPLGTISHWKLPPLPPGPTQGLRVAHKKGHELSELDKIEIFYRVSGGQKQRDVARDLECSLPTVRAVMNEQDPVIQAERRARLYDLIDQTYGVMPGLLEALRLSKPRDSMQAALAVEKAVNSIKVLAELGERIGAAGVATAMDFPELIAEYEKHRAGRAQVLPLDEGTKKASPEAGVVD